MKDIVLIAIIGNDRVYGCPMHNNQQEFDAYFRELTIDGIIAITKKTLDRLPSKSPPFACRPTYIISEEPCPLEAGLKQTFVVPSIEDAFAATLDEKKTLYVIVDETIHDKLLESYKEHIGCIVVGQMNEAGSGTGTFPELPIFGWRPLIVLEKERKGKHSPGFVINKFTSQFFDI